MLDSSIESVFHHFLSTFSVIDSVLKPVIMTVP